MNLFHRHDRIRYEEKMWSEDAFVEHWHRYWYCSCGKRVMVLDWSVRKNPDEVLIF